MIPEAKFQQMVERQKENRKKSYARHLANLHSSREYMVRDSLKTVRVGNRYGSKTNDFRYNLSSSDEHEDMKYQIYKQLRRAGHEVLVEAIFESGLRADILDLCCQRVIEIKCSESEESLARKELTYPSLFEIVVIDTAKPLEVLV